MKSYSRKRNLCSQLWVLSSEGTLIQNDFLSAPLRKRGRDQSSKELLTFKGVTSALILMTGGSAKRRDPCLDLSLNCARNSLWSGVPDRCHATLSKITTGGKVGEQEERNIGKHATSEQTLLILQQKTVDQPSVTQACRCQQLKAQSKCLRESACVCMRARVRVSLSPSLCVRERQTELVSWCFEPG